MPANRANVKDEKQYEALKDKGMSKQRAAKTANSPARPRRAAKESGSGGNAKQGGTTAQHKAVGRNGGRCGKVEATGPIPTFGRGMDRNPHAASVLVVIRLVTKKVAGTR